MAAVWIPESAHEAMRDLVRARLAAVRSLRQARQQLSGFLLRQVFESFAANRERHLWWCAIISSISVPSLTVIAFAIRDRF